MANDFNTESDLKELEQFILENEENLGTAQMTANQMIEGTRSACSIELLKGVKQRDR